VYAENFRTYLQSIPADELQNLGGYELHLRRERAEARGNLGALFASDRYASLLASFGRFLEGAPTEAALRRWRSFRIRDGVKKYLKRSARRVLKLGGKIDSDSPAKRLHRLRIRAKRLRYELEFFREVYPSLDRAAKAAKRLQDVLGEHQDACTASERLTDYARSLATRGARRRAIPPALDHLLRGQEQKAREMRDAFAAEWRRFERTLEHARVVGV
jgi:CHAD domain-containing protein